jgi:hypothetical protein
MLEELLVIILQEIWVIIFVECAKIIVVQKDVEDVLI